MKPITNSDQKTAHFEYKQLSESGEEYVVVPREFELVEILPDGTILLRWRPLDRHTPKYLEVPAPTHY